MVCRCHRDTSRYGAGYEVSVFDVRLNVKTENFASEIETVNPGKPHLFARDWVEYRFKSLVERTMREQHSEERRLAERHTRKHRLEARKSCIPDARNYRIARRLLMLARAQF